MAPSDSSTERSFRYPRRSPAQARPAPAGQPLWPEKIIELCADWKADDDGTRRDAILARLWVLLNDSLGRYLRVHQARLGRVGLEDTRDIASEKALDLFRKLARGEWDPTVTSAAQLCTLISTVARNGLVDHLRVAGPRRQVSLDSGDIGEEPSLGETAVESALDQRRFATALRDCVSHLTPRARKTWMLRVFFELPSKVIARHPDVGVSSAAVDMTLARCRTKIRRCMKRKGFLTHDLPPGTFATLWSAFRNGNGSRGAE